MLRTNFHAPHMIKTQVSPQLARQPNHFEHRSSVSSSSYARCLKHEAFLPFCSEQSTRSWSVTVEREGFILQPHLFLAIFTQRKSFSFNQFYSWPANYFVFLARYIFVYCCQVSWKFSQHESDFQNNLNIQIRVVQHDYIFLTV